MNILYWLWLIYTSVNLFSSRFSKFYLPFRLTSPLTSQSVYKRNTLVRSWAPASPTRPVTILTFRDHEVSETCVVNEHNVTDNQAGKLWKGQSGPRRPGSSKYGNTSNVSSYGTEIRGNWSTAHAAEGSGVGTIFLAIRRGISSWSSPAEGGKGMWGLRMCHWIEPRSIKTTIDYLEIDWWKYSYWQIR